jgi:fructosamine-3-kinase
LSSEITLPVPFQSFESAREAILCDNRRVIKKTPLSGGDINRAYKLTLTDGTFLFLKENSKSNLSFFTAEFQALVQMSKVGEIGIVTPLAYGLEGENAFLILPWLESAPEAPDYWKAFGRSFAHFHLSGRGDKYGYYRDNYIGSTAQPNCWKNSWVDFFREERLEYQVRMAAELLKGNLSRSFIRLLDRLDNYLPEPAFPSLLHGDLWSGNIHTGPDGQAWLIDPAAYYGHPEADLAMTELFGSQPEAFYRSYGEVNPIDKEYGERRDIYNLYHLLNHLNMFGLSYLGSVKAILQRYI